MDLEIRDILNKILNSQTSMSEDIRSMKSDISTLQKDVGSMKGDISTLQKDVGSMKGDISTLQKDVGSMKGDISTLQKDVDSLQAQVTKNTLLLEKTQKDIQLIIDVQKSHYEQNQREHQEMITTMNNRAAVIELAVKSISTNLVEIKEDSQSMSNIIGHHSVSIETMKRKLANIS